MGPKLFQGTAFKPPSFRRTLLRLTIKAREAEAFTNTVTVPPEASVHYCTSNVVNKASDLLSLGITRCSVSRRCADDGISVARNCRNLVRASAACHYSLSKGPLVSVDTTRELGVNVHLVSLFFVKPEPLGHSWEHTASASIPSLSLIAV